ncbi:hypothetical protein A2U01_0036696, partial [Trifolium medium]|nr:hypothetical protein [Trifolium medium]
IWGTNVKMVETIKVHQRQSFKQRATGYQVFKSILSQCNMLQIKTLQVPKALKC